MIRSRLLAFAAYAFTGLAMGGCAVVQEKTIGEAFDDTSTGSQIEAQLLLNGGLSQFGEVDVEVADRLVLLAGRVPSEQARQEAERMAWTVDAVDEVANELVITDRDWIRDINDPWIAARIRARILGDKNVQALNYNIHVFDGTVYLLGFAQSDDELRRAAEQASVVRGVKRVVSYVKLRDRIVSPQVDSAYSGEAPTSETQAPAPVVAPERMPTQRSAYSDPYSGDLPPASSKNDFSGAPTRPVDGDFQ